MNKTLTSAAAVLALIALPVAGATAKPGKGRGHGQALNTQSDGGRVASGPIGERSPTRGSTSRKCRRPQSVGFVAKGSLAGFTAEDVTLDVERANKHARAYIKAAGSTFTLGTARVQFEGVTDDNADGVVDFADVQPTDMVKAIGKASRPKRGCTGETVLTLRKVQVERPVVEEEVVEDEV